MAACVIQLGRNQVLRDQATNRVTSAAFPRPASFRCQCRTRLQACFSSDSVQAVTEQEDAANKKRWEESGNTGNVDQWRWSLNWDDITDNIVVGACPRSPDDVDRLVNEAKIDAIICLQSDGCFDALKIDWEAIRNRGLERDVVMTRVAIWDFNHGDQALMLPEAVRMLAILVAMGKRVYVHCTAGINRATLTVVGYLTFVQGWELHDAVNFVKKKRPQAHPYIDCWKTVRSRLTEGRTEEIIATASRLYEGRAAGGQEDMSSSGDDFGDWLEAEKIIIRETFQRQITANLSLLAAVKDMEKIREEESVCMPPQEFESIQAEMGMLRGRLAEERAHLRTAQAQLAKTNEEVRLLRVNKPEARAQLEDREAREKRLKLAETEISSLKSAIREVAMSAYKAVRIKESKPDGAGQLVNGLASHPVNDSALSSDAIVIDQSPKNAQSGVGQGSDAEPVSR